MSNSQITARFFAASDSKITELVLANIAQHYRITPSEALAGVMHVEAEHLLMQRHGLGLQTA